MITAIPETIGASITSTLAIVYGDPGATPEDCIAIKLGRDERAGFQDDHKNINHFGGSPTLTIATVTITCRGKKYSTAAQGVQDVWDIFENAKQLSNMDVIPQGTFKYIGRDEKMLHVFKGYYRIIYKGE